jgi:predicted secreted protein
MAEASGRALQIFRYVGATYVLIASVKSKSVEKSNSGIDVTTDDDDGWQTLLATPGVRAVNLNISGVTDDDILMTAISADTASIVLEDIKVLYPSGAFDIGDFQFSSFSQTGEVDGAVVFDATFASSGAITHTAAV